MHIYDEQKVPYLACKVRVFLTKFGAVQLREAVAAAVSTADDNVNSAPKLVKPQGIFVWNMTGVSKWVLPERRAAINYQ